MVTSIAWRDKRRREELNKKVIWLDFTLCIVSEHPLCNVRASRVFLITDAFGWSSTISILVTRRELSGVRSTLKSQIPIRSMAYVLPELRIYLRIIRKYIRRDKWPIALSPTNELSSTCRRRVADMSPTSPNVAKSWPTLRVVATRKRPRHTQFMSITADKYKSAQTHELATLP